MAKVSALKRLLRSKVPGFKNRTKSFSGAAKTTAIIAGGGALAGFANAPAGVRKEGALEGAFAAGTLAAAATIGTKIVFRRIRGRIIPIRVKAK